MEKLKHGRRKEINKRGERKKDEVKSESKEI